MTVASTAAKVVRVEHVAARLHVVRGENVMLDADLAELYGVPTKYLNLAVRRNTLRFPSDFMFQLSPEEAAGLRLQIATSKSLRGGRRYAPLAFTEQGVAMLSSVLHSARAIEVNIAIMRTFMRVRRLLSTNLELAKQVARHDLDIATIFTQMGKWMAQPQKKALPAPKRRKRGPGAVQVIINAKP